MPPADINGFETVHTVTGIWDGPRIGIADYNGQPHAFESLFEDGRDGVDSFLLQAIDAETFKLAMEAWVIWCRWQLAFENGQTTIDTHPALPSDRPRHDKLESILEPRLRIQPERALQRRGYFEARVPMGFGSPDWAIFWLSEDQSDAANPD